jgi:C_GCAxxG_C_C family probable redox protein
MNDRVSSAINLFGGGFNCAQSVVSSFSTDIGLDIIDALRVSGMFGSGMGQMGNVCGAATGAFMVIGLKYSKTRAGEDPQKMEGYALVRKFTDRFAHLHGTIKCRDLIGVDLNTPEGIAEAKENKLFETRCAAYVRDAVQVLEDILNG